MLHKLTILITFLLIACSNNIKHTKVKPILKFKSGDCVVDVGNTFKGLIVSHKKDTYYVLVNTLKYPKVPIFFTEDILGSSTSIIMELKERGIMKCEK